MYYCISVNMDLKDEEMEWILDFNVPSGSDASFCDSEDQMTDDDNDDKEKCRQKDIDSTVERNHFIPVHIDVLLGNVNSETRFDDDNINADGVIIMETDDVDNYENFVKTIDQQLQSEKKNIRLSIISF